MTYLRRIILPNYTYSADYICNDEKDRGKSRKFLQEYCVADGCSSLLASKTATRLDNTSHISQKVPRRLTHTPVRYIVTPSKLRLIILAFNHDGREGNKDKKE